MAFWNSQQEESFSLRAFSPFGKNRTTRHPYSTSAPLDFERRALAPRLLFGSQGSTCTNASAPDRRRKVTRIVMNETRNQTSERPISRFLRRKHSQEYFTGTGWSRNIEDAKTCADALEAVQTCLRFRLENVEMVLRVNGASHDLFCTEIRNGNERPSAPSAT